MDEIWNCYNLKSTRQIETFEQETVSRVIYMQDGAPPHFSCFVTDVLNERLDWSLYTCLTRLYGGIDMYNLLH